MPARRFMAAGALVFLAASIGLAVLGIVRSFPTGLLVALGLVLAAAAAWQAILRRGTGRTAFLGLAVALLAGSLAILLVEGVVLEAVLALVCFAAALSCAKRAFAVHIRLPPAEPPQRPVVIWNPRSGGGKALAADLATEARARGIEPIELRPGDDLERLVRDAVARGADALAAAGGDGTQALVASIAAEHDLPFACIPAGTRNHFALDLGVDRTDVVGALDAFVTGGERRVDLAEVNGRTFVNNVSLGVYADAVQREGYRDAKLRTILDTLPDVLGPDGSGGTTLGWTSRGGTAHDDAAVILVSNNVYRLGRGLGSGTRPRIDDGLLGIAVLEAPPGPGRPRRRLRAPWRQWSSPAFEVRSGGPVPAGVDGEALTLDPPLRFVIRRHALRVRLAPQHPGASPSVAQPTGPRDVLRQLARIAAGDEPVT